MLSVVTLDDNTGTAVTIHADTPTSKRCLTSAEGLRGVQSLRDSKRVRPQAHGGINETRWEDGRTVTLIGEIASQIGIEDAFNEFALVSAPMLQTLDNAPSLLKWTEGTTGNQLQRFVKLDGDLDPVLSDAASIISYQAQFFSEDPRAYSQTLQTVISAALSTSGGGHTFPAPYNRSYGSSGGGTVSFTNAGNRSTPPKFQVYGYAVNPVIVVVGTGLKLSFIGTINAGDYLEVDAAKRTVMLNGLTNRYNFYDPANSTWFDLPGGAAGATTNLQLIAGTFDGNALLKVIGRSAYA